MDANHGREATGPIEGRWEREDGSGAGRYTRTTVHVDRDCHPYVAAPGQQPRCCENRGGDFYTDVPTCLICDIPHEAAPDLMAYVQHPGDTWPHCVFTRQPRTPEEIERAIDAMCASEVCGIRYGAADPDILRQIAARGAAAQATSDQPPPSP